MLHHCYNTEHAAYRMYGAQGATVCDTWRDSFEAFLADVGDRPSTNHVLFRHDKSLPYQPGNVAWVTRSYCSAFSKSGRGLLTILGVTKTIKEWSEESNVARSIIRSRKASGIADHLLLIKGDLRSRGLREL